MAREAPPPARVTAPAAPSAMKFGLGRMGLLRPHGAALFACGPAVSEPRPLSIVT